MTLFPFQIDPDNRPSFEEVLQTLEDIVLSDKCLEESDVETDKVHSNSSQKDLQSSISEPLLHLDDRGMVLGAHAKSCDGGRELEESSTPLQRSHLRQRQFNSIGSSNDSSYDSIAEEDGVFASHYLEKTEGSFGLERHDKLSEAFAEKGTGVVSESYKTQDDSQCIEADDGNDVHGDISTSIGRSRSASTAQGAEENGKHHILLQKSNSLDNHASKENRTNHLCDSETGNLERNLSMQTLVDTDEIRKGVGEVVNSRGGDSGIDPGEMDVFKFPQEQQSTSASVEQSGDVGDHTPVWCTSPDSMVYESKPLAHISTALHILRDSRDLMDGVRDQVPSPILSPTSQSMHLVTRTISTEDRDEPRRATGMKGAAYTTQTHSISPCTSSDMSRVDGTTFITPTDHSVSPLEESWASSEFSFNLPSPSTPWAPPCSPMPPNTPRSLPTSPSFFLSSPRHLAHRHRTNHHKYSQAISDDVHPPCLRKTCVPQRPHSCRNSALFTGSKVGFDLSDRHNVAELQDDFEQMMKLPKTVHFMENCHHEVEDVDDIQLRMMHCTQKGGGGFIELMPRPRSKSSPPRKIFTSAMKDGKESSSLKEYGISLKHDLLNVGGTCSSKHYKIVQISHTRLSSSAPDLSKLTNSSIPVPYQ